jgi:hypothetical protein
MWERFAALLRQYPLLRPRITHCYMGGAGSMGGYIGVKITAIAEMICKSEHLVHTT